jgi:TPR repeat protein
MKQFQFFLLLHLPLALFGQIPNFDQLLKKAKSGDAKAQYEVGFLYAHGVEHSTSEAIKWYRKAEAQGHA